MVDEAIRRDYLPVDKVTCVVRVQHRPGMDRARWRSAVTPDLCVCDRHRAQYDVRDDFGFYGWQEIS